MELDNNLYNKITELSEEGNDHIFNGEYELAIKKYQAAFTLIPTPKYDWEASTWIYTALGDTFYLISQYQEALDNLSEALKCPGGIENPFISLRIGQCYYELNNLNKAREYLLQAYMYEGDEIFREEEDKYIKLIKDLV